MSLALAQEAELLALGQVKEEAPVEEPEQSDSEASSDEGFGITKKPKVAAEVESAEAARRGAAKSEAKPQRVKKTPADVGASEEEKCCAKVEAALAAVDAWFSPTAYWLKQLKERENNAKLGKLSSTLASLAQFQGSAAADALIKKAEKKTEELQLYMQTLDSLQEIIHPQRAEPALLTLQHARPEDVDVVASLPADCLGAVLTDLGNCMIEACWRSALKLWFLKLWLIDGFGNFATIRTSSQKRFHPQECCTAAHKDYHDYFFRFISLAENTKGFHFSGFLLAPNTALSLPDMLALQCALCNSWIDKFKTLSESATDMLLGSTPSVLLSAALTRPANHNGLVTISWQVK